MSLESNLENLLKDVKQGKLLIKEALKELKKISFSDLGFAKVDLHRELRCGFPEVIYSPGKNPSQVKKIAEELAKVSQENILATRAERKTYLELKKSFPEAKYLKNAKLIVIERVKRKRVGSVLVVSGGTSDLAVAEEATEVAKAMGSYVEKIYDIGIAGVHRLLAHQEELAQARVIVAVAGMEGALPSLIAGLVSAPVVAVPTSVGYGASFSGLAALLTMLNSCSNGVSVVNIDNGFGAGYLAHLINKLAEGKTNKER